MHRFQEPANPAPRHARNISRTLLNTTRNGAMITNDFIIAKLFRAYSANFFRQNKSLLDNTPARRNDWARCGASVARREWDVAGKGRKAASTAMGGTPGVRAPRQNA
jgi:hypothetical protein